MGRMPGRRPPPAAGVRIAWDEVPEAVRHQIEGRLGSPVVEAVTQPGGFSPGLAARLRTASGQRVFVKGVPPDRNPDSPAIHRREAAVVSRLPAGLPVPRFLWWFDEEWVVLAFEDVDGRHPRQPWDPGELKAVLRAIDRLTEALTPAPIPVPPAGDLFGGWQGWRQLAKAPPKRLDPWAGRHLDRLIELEAVAPLAVSGETLLHLDIRADNLLLAAGSVFVVDWPWASLGAAWLEALAFAPSVEMQGGPPAPEVIAGSAGAAGADTGAVAAALAELTGMFVHRGGLSPPPGLP